MSTTPIDSWAVDLADVTFIYPWVGQEGLMALIGIVLWILWHVWQIRNEKREFQNELDNYANKENIEKAVRDG